MRTNLFLAFGFMLFATACQKNGNEESVTLSASNTTVSVGETVEITATTGANTIGWSATPASNVSGAYTISTEKKNFYSFSAPGTYRIGVRTRNLKLDSIRHCNRLDPREHVKDSIWHHNIGEKWHKEGHHRGGCKRGKDSASVVITVKNK